MGNAAMACSGGLRGAATPPSRLPITVLQADGNVITLHSSRLRVLDLILTHPNHFVCHSSSLVLLHHGKILPLHTLLVPGEVYFLLPMPTSTPTNNLNDESESDTSSLLHIEPPRRAVHRTGSTKFVISTEQFSKIMAGSIKEGGGRGGGGGAKRKRVVRSSKVMVQKSVSGGSGSTAAPWRPGLSSIEEVAAN